jgi:hypothetical protein
MALQLGINLSERRQLAGLARERVEVPEPWMSVLDAEGRLPEPPERRPLGFMGSTLSSRHPSEPWASPMHIVLATASACNFCGDRPSRRAPSLSGSPPPARATERSWLVVSSANRLR